MLTRVLFLSGYEMALVKHNWITNRRLRWPSEDVFALLKINNRKALLHLFEYFN